MKVEEDEEAKTNVNAIAAKKVSNTSADKHDNNLAKHESVNSNLQDSEDNTGGSD